MLRSVPAQPSADRMPGFYRRPLPEPGIAFSSPEGRVLFGEALADGSMAGYFALAEQFHTQSEPAYCGLGTLVVILNALQIDPGRLWKGPWRWFGEELLDCCAPLATIAQSGITLERFACLARCNGATAVVERTSGTRLQDFRQALERACTTPDQPHLAVSYDRHAVGQTGQGHFSPVAGLHRDRDMVLILDVARFKYPPHWLPISTLWQAMASCDTETGRYRGWIELARNPQSLGVLTNLLGACVGSPGRGLQEPSAINQRVAEQVLARPELDLVGLAQTLNEALGDTDPQPSDATAQTPADPGHTDLLNARWAELRSSRLYGQLQAAIAASEERRAMIAMILMAAPESLLRACSPQLRATLSDLTETQLPAGLTSELEWLRLQWRELTWCES